MGAGGTTPNREHPSYPHFVDAGGFVIIVDGIIDGSEKYVENRTNLGRFPRYYQTR